MHRLSLILLLLTLAASPVLAQRGKKRHYPPAPPPPGSEGFTSLDNTCVYLDSFSVESRQRMHPFRRALRMVLISYLDEEELQNPQPRIIGEIPTDTTSYRYSDTLNREKIVEAVELNLAGVDSLSALLFNYMPAYMLHPLPPVYATGVSGTCFIPRNAVLFYNRRGKLVESLDVCFECGSFKDGWEALPVGFPCDDKIELLRAFFVQRGIRYGTTRK